MCLLSLVVIISFVVILNISSLDIPDISRLQFAVSIQSCGNLCYSNLELMSFPNPSKINQPIAIVGNLTTTTGTPLSQRNVIIQYSEDSLEWTNLFEATTDDVGNFSLRWSPSQEGQLYIRASAGAKYALVEHVVAKYIVAVDGSGDFASIEEAIKALPANGAVVYVKEGNYSMTRMVNLVERSNTTLIGSGYKTAIIKARGITFKIANVSNLILERIHFHHSSNDAYTAIRVEGENDGIIISKCWFTREKQPASAATDLLYFDAASSTQNLLIGDCYFENAQIDAMAIKKVRNCIIEKNKVVDCATDYYAIASGVTVDRSSNVTIRKNYFIRTENQNMTAINVFGNSIDIIIEKNEITSMLRGINIDEAENIHVRSNRIVNSSEVGIRVEDAFKVLIESNYFETTAADTTAVFATTIQDLVIISNTIQQKGSGIVIMHSNNIMVDSNSIVGGAIFVRSKSCLSLYNCTETEVSENKIMRSCYFGLGIYLSPEINVVGNNISGSMLSGIYLWRSNYSVIQSNVIQSNGQYELFNYERNGIDVADSCNCTIQQNHIFDNQIIKTQQFGLVEKRSSNHNIIVLNDFRFNAKDAMKIIGTHTVATDNLT